jgi:hypothetical protein
LTQHDLDTIASNFKFSAQKTIIKPIGIFKIDPPSAALAIFLKSRGIESPRFLQFCRWGLLTKRELGREYHGVAWLQDGPGAEGHLPRLRGKLRFENRDASDRATYPLVSIWIDNQKNE